MSNDAWWAIIRSSGLVSWVFLTLTVVWGALVAGRLTHRPGARRWLLDLHPYLGTLGLTTLVLHIVATVADGMSRVGWVGSLVPFTSAWNPVGVGLGVLGFWTLVAVEVTTIARRRLARRTWHRIHLASYAGAWLTAVHAAASGTDLRNPAIAWGSLGLVAVGTVVAIRRLLGTGGSGHVPVGA